MKGFRDVALPYPGKSIRQNGQAQGVSLASALLVETALQADLDPKLRVLDMGCGCGIVSIMCALARPNWQIYGIDIQEDLISLARENARACAVEADFETQDLRLHRGQYDLILSNPPWQKVGTGMLSPLAAKNLSRVELTCTMPDVLQALQRCMAKGAKAILIYPHKRQKELESLLCKTSLDIISTHTQSGKKAYFCATLSIGNRS